MAKNRHSQSELLWKNHRKGWILTLTLLLAATFLVGENANYLKLSLLTIPEHAPFDGTVYPIQEVPNWLTLNKDNDEVTYPELTPDQLVSAPTYDPAILAIPNENLTWGNPKDDATRQMKLTYAVPYAGSYRSNGIEGDGSHPAVDIRVPGGTPVYAIANGVVDRVTHSSSGFGNLIVIKHTNVPSLENSSIKETIYSGYAHLETILVTEGEVITKNQIIGSVGETGTATTHHLHFQIDNDQAPWHLYWPFTSTESNNVGGFFEAINQGVGRENVTAYTLSPLKYVQTYLNYQGSLLPETTPATNVNPNFVPTSETDQTTTNNQEISTSDLETTEPKVYIAPFSNIEVEYQTLMTQKSEQILKISLLDENNKIVTNPSYNAPIKITVSNPEIIQITQKELPSYRFVSGPTEIDAESNLKEGSSEITITFLGKEFARFSIQVSTNTEGSNKLVAGGKNENEVLPVFTDLKKDNPYYQAITTLQKQKVVQGYPDGTFQANKAVSRVEALKVILAISGDTIISGTEINFKDTKNDQWYSDYLATAQMLGIVQGYPDGTFKPDQEVNRVEFIKMLTKALKIDVDPVVIDNPYLDINRLEWYAPYAQFVKETNISPWNTNLAPSTAMSRGEVAEMLYRILVLEEKNATVYTSDLTI